MPSPFTPPKPLPQVVIIGAFMIGLVSAIAVRLIILAQHIEPRWVRPLWYVAVVGNMAFFLYRAHISRKRKRAIDQPELIRKIQDRGELDNTDRAALLYVLRSVKLSYEDINYAVIFVLSIIAIAADMLLAAAK